MNCIKLMKESLCEEEGRGMVLRNCGSKIVKRECLCE